MVLGTDFDSHGQIVAPWTSDFESSPTKPGLKYLKPMQSGNKLGLTTGSSSAPCSGSSYDTQKLYKMEVWCSFSSELRGEIHIGVLVDGSKPENRLCGHMVHMLGP